MSDTNLEKAAEAAKNFRIAIGELRADRACLDADRQVLLQRREVLYLQPVSNADMQQFLVDYIDARASCWDAECGWANLIKQVALPARNPDFAEHHGITTEELCLRDIEIVMEQPSASNAQALGIAFINFYGRAGAAMAAGSDAPFYFFFGDIIKQKLAERFDVLCPSESRLVGAPVTERKTEIKELDAQIAVLTSKINHVDAKLKELSRVR